MNTVVVYARPAAPQARRCSEYDAAECARVTDHARCWRGVNREGKSQLLPADGYCPYLVGGEVKR